MSKAKVYLSTQSPTTYKILIIAGTVLGVILFLYGATQSAAIKQILGLEVQAAEVHKEILEPFGYYELLKKAEQAKDVKELEEIAEKLFAEKDKYGYFDPANRCVLDAIYYQNKVIIKQLKHLTGEK